MLEERRTRKEDNLCERMVSYQDQREERRRNCRSWCKSLNHDGNVSNGCIIPRTDRLDIRWRNCPLTSGNSTTRQYLIPFRNLITERSVHFSDCFFLELTFRISRNCTCYHPSAHRLERRPAGSLAVSTVVPRDSKSID
jgi:hypothetical protein